MILWNLTVNKEMEEAATGRKAWPTGYWCHSFKLVAMSWIWIEPFGFDCTCNVILALHNFSQSTHKVCRQFWVKTCCWGNFQVQTQIGTQGRCCTWCILIELKFIVRAAGTQYAKVGNYYGDFLFIVIIINITCRTCCLLMFYNAVEYKE